MGFLDKLKNTFFEEEYVEVDEKPRKQPKEVKQVIKEPIIKQEVEEEFVVEKAVEKRIEPEIVEEKIEEPPKTTKADVFSYFDEDDFLDYDSSSKDVRRMDDYRPPVYDNPVYGSKKNTNMTTSNPYSKSENNSRKFTPTPIISPIYGVLDKNYTKDEVHERKEIKPSSSYVSRKNADLDSIRAKAFGSSDKKEQFNFNDDFIDDINFHEIETEMEDIVEDHLLYDMTDIDKTPSVDKVTLQDAEEYFSDLGLEYNVDYKDVKLEKATGRRVKSTPSISIEEDDEMIIPGGIDDKFDDSDLSLEDNLFDLIDSMYEDKE